MIKRLLLSACLLAPLFSITGCAINKESATVTAGADLSKIKTVYLVKQPRDNRGIDDLIATKLQKQGFVVTRGPELNTAYAADAAVTYVDKWMWDLTLYLEQLTITFREAQGNFPIASGNSVHTSLTRKAPPEMVEEVVNNIMSAQKK